MPVADAVSAFSDWLAKEMRARGHGDNKSHLATYAGIPYGTVSAWFNRGTRPSYDNCRALAEKLRVPLNEVLQAAGYPPESESEPLPDSLPEWVTEVLDRLTREESKVVRDTGLSLLELRETRAPFGDRPAQADDESPPATRTPGRPSRQ